MGNLLQHRYIRQLLHSLQPILVAVMVALLLIVMVLTVLNALDIVALSNAWVNAIGIFLAALGVLAAFNQWFPPVEASPPPLDQKRETYRKQIKRELNKRLKKGALVIFTTEDQVGYEFHLISQKLWKYASRGKNRLSPDRKDVARRHRLSTGYVCAVVYRDLDPDDYIVWTDISHPDSVAVFPNEVAIVEQLH